MTFRSAILRFCLAALSAGGLMLGAAQAQTAQSSASWARYEASEIKLDNIVAVVRVVPERRSDMAVAIRNPGPLPTPRARVSGERLIIDGDVSSRRRECRGEGRDLSLRVPQHGWINEAHMPVIELRVPENVSINAEGAARLFVAPAQSARVNMNGCGSADLESVRGEASLAITGQIEARLHEAGSAEIRIATAGEVDLGAIHNGLTISIAGAGDINAARVDGPTNIAIQGAGDVNVRAGRAAPLSIVISGAGDVRHDGAATALDAVIMGAGDVWVRRVEGRVSRRVLGLGEITVGGD